VKKTSDSERGGSTSEEIGLQKTLSEWELPDVNGDRGGVDVIGQESLRKAIIPKGKTGGEVSGQER